jgi:hypothetical protein
VVGPTSTEGVNKFVANLAKKTNVSLPELEANFFKTERPGTLLKRFALESNDLLRGSISATIGWMKRSLASFGIHDVTKRYGDFLIQSRINAMKEILQEEVPDAVFCAKDYMAAGAIKLLSESGLQVPRDISVIGYDNNDICQGIVPSLTTVDHRLEELGRCLGQGLLGLIEGIDIEVRKSIMPVIVERQSHCARPTASYCTKSATATSTRRNFRTR